MYLFLIYTGVQGSKNSGYDDENGSYIKVQHDHIAYRYEVLETLGKGSFGQVVKAIDHCNGETVRNSAAISLIWQLFA